MATIYETMESMQQRRDYEQQMKMLRHMQSAERPGLSNRDGAIVTAPNDIELSLDGPSVFSEMHSAIKNMAAVLPTMQEVANKINLALGREAGQVADLVEVMPLLDELLALRAERAEYQMANKQPGSLGVVINDPNGGAR